MTYTYDVECSSNYNVELLPYWCKLVSKDSNSFVINHDANPSSSERTGWFRVVASNGKSIDIHLNQAGGVEFNSRGYGYMGTSREYTDVASPLSSLRNSIKKWGECKTGSLTEKGVGIVIYGTNGYSFQELPTNISSNIKEIHKDGKVIKDVALSGASWWIVVYGKNSWRGVVPDKMQSRLEEYIREGDEIKSVSINENGDFTIVTDKHFAASNDSDMEFIRKAHDKFGFVHSACTTPMGIIVCCEMGIYYGNIPKNIVERIKKLTFNPKIVKYTDSGTCLFTDGEKKNDYYM